MRNLKKILLLGITISLFTSFVALAEGMTIAGPANFAPERTEAIYSYVQADGSLLKSQWKQVWDNWYYFDEKGKTKQSTWSEIDGKWYYFDQWSIMLHDTTTPDGYYVGSDGAWDQNEPVAVQ